jgi:putative transposase
MWAYLNREGLEVARCTIERLMRANGWQGVRRQARVRTTIPDPAAERAPDLVDRKFGATAPNWLLVADFTYVRLVTGSSSTSRSPSTPTPARSSTGRPRPASGTRAALRARQGHPLVSAIHHSDAGVPVHQCPVRRNPCPLWAAALDRDSYDNALAETTIGLCKHECVRGDSPCAADSLRCA